MAQTATQSFENHARIVPPFHMGVFGVFTLNLGWSIYRLVRTPGADALVAMLVAGALIVLAFYTRRFALTVQDRVIRLEMQLRLRGLLPPDLQSRIPNLTHGQLIAMRFASDEELPDLCRTVLRDNVTRGSDIKKMIKNWKADHLRA